MRNSVLAVIVCAMASLSWGALPDGYTELDYVQSTKKQAVKTGYTPNANTKIEVVFSVDEYKDGGSYKGAYIFGCYGSSGGRCQFRYGSPLFVGWGDDYDNSNFKSFPVDSKRHTVIVDRGTFSIDSETSFYSKNWSGSSDKLALFGSNSGGTLNESLFSAIKIYSAVISEGDTVLRRFVPAKNSEGEVGFYDLAEGATVKFYKSATGTPLVAPPESGVPSLSGFETGGSYNNGAWAKVSVASDDTLNTTVDCYMGADPSTWDSIWQWDHVTSEAVYAATNSPVAYGDMFYAAFKVTYKHDGKTCEMWTATNTIEITGKVDWKGAKAGAAWSVANNWDPKVIPNAALSAYFTGDHLVTAGAEELTARAIVISDSVTSFAFEPETTLDFTYLHIGNSQAGSKLAVTNGVLNSSQGIDFPKNNCALVLYGTQATFAGSLDLSSTGDQAVVRNGSHLSVKGVKGVVGAGSIRVLDGSALCATGTDGVVIMNNETMTVDGGSVTNDGVLYVGSLNAAETWKGGNNTPAVLRIVNGGTWVQRYGYIHLAQCRSANICVADDSLFDATGYGIYFPNTTDALQSAAAADSFFDVTNSTVRAKNLNIGYHPRRCATYTMRMIGEQAELEVEGDIRLGAGWHSDACRNGASVLEVDGATVTAGGNLVLGTEHDGLATNTLEVAGAAAKVTAANLTCTTNAVIRFVIPEKGFDEERVVAATNKITLAKIVPTPIEIDATACRSGEWQTLLAAEKGIENLSREQIEVLTAPGRYCKIRITENELKCHVTQGMVLIFR